ncbi:MAG: DUF6785 family protein [Armatimonadota bacterium]
MPKFQGQLRAAATSSIDNFLKGLRTRGEGLMLEKGRVEPLVRPEKRPSPPFGLSWRSVSLALVLVAIFAYITPYNDYDLANTFVAGNLLPTSSMLVLLTCVFLVNPIFRKLAPKFALRSHELATLWALIVIASGIPAAGLWRYIIPQLPNLFYRASAANRWDELLFPHAPSWLVITDKAAAKGFYEGTGGRILWDAWLTPLAFWLPFAFAFFFALFCLATLLRRQWMEREQFTFPLVQLPYELTREPASGKLLPPLLYSPALWVGFFATSLLHTFCGLNTYFPNVPAVRRSRSLGEYISGFPWDAIAGTGIHIYPAAIGLTYLLTTEVAFSLWFFYVLERVQQLLFAYYGWSGLGYSATDFVQYQQVGAVLGLIFIIAYAARSHWKQVIAKSLPFTRAHANELADDSEEPMPYAFAFWGFVFTSLGLFVVLVALGMDTLLALTFLVMAYGFYLAVSWIATNGGMVMVQMRILPFDPLVAIFGTKRFSPKGILTMCLLQEAFTYDQREFLMPSILNGMKMAQLSGLKQRPLMFWGAIAVVLAAFVSLYAWLKLGYTKGAVTLTKTATFFWHANYPYMLAAQYIDPGMTPNWFRVNGMIVGLVGFIGLYLLRLQFSLPIHPVGWIVCRGWAMEQFWLMILLGWLAKAVIVRYGGLTGYKAMRPFFLGIVLGDLTMAGIFTIVGFITQKGYAVMPL